MGRRAAAIAAGPTASAGGEPADGITGTGAAVGITAASGARVRAAAVAAIATVPAVAVAAVALRTVAATATVGVAIVGGDVADAINAYVGHRPIQHAGRDDVGGVER